MEFHGADKVHPVILNFFPQRVPAHVFISEKNSRRVCFYCYYYDQYYQDCAACDWKDENLNFRFNTPHEN